MSLDIEAYRQEMLMQQLAPFGLTAGQATYVINRIRKKMRNKECMDNFRICSGRHLSSAYMTIKNRGCCGVVDERIELKDGKIINFGFNYGH